jgi:hypothetical protein
MQEWARRYVKEKHGQECWIDSACPGGIEFPGVKARPQNHAVNEKAAQYEEQIDAGPARAHHHVPDLLHSLALCGQVLPNDVVIVAEEHEQDRQSAQPLHRLQAGLISGAEFKPGRQLITSLPKELVDYLRPLTHRRFRISPLETLSPTFCAGMPATSTGS